MSNSAILLSDVFLVEDINPDGKKFDKVNRLVCKGETYLTSIILDIASEIYKVNKGDRLIINLTSSIKRDGTPDDDTYSQTGERTLLDDFEYAQHGRTFKYEYEQDKKVSVIASFGGLLMKVTGEQSVLAKLKIDQSIYCLIKMAN